MYFYRKLYTFADMGVSRVQDYGRSRGAYGLRVMSARSEPSRALRRG